MIHRRRIVIIVLTITAGCDVRGLVGGSQREELEALKARVAALEAKLASREQGKSDSKIDLEICLLEANEKYWNYVKLNGRLDRRKSTPGNEIWSAPTRIWDHAEEMKKNATEACRIRYGGG